MSIRISRPVVITISTALAMCAAASGSVFAQDYPERPITLVVPYPAGGASDIIARLIAQGMHESINQTVVVENRPGANGIIAYSHVAKSPADGYTILMGNIGPSSINPSIYKKLPYDAITDFAPVTLVSWVPLMIVTNPALGVNTLPELIAKAKASPGAINYGVSGLGTAGHLAMELFKSDAKITMTAVNYKGDTPALSDTMAGHIQMMMPTVVAGAPIVASGKLKALAVTTPKRLDAYPDLPTVAEAGLQGFEAVSWGGILAPAGTPRPIIDKLNTEIGKILDQPGIQKRFSEVGAQAVHGTPEEFAQYIANEAAKWGKIARASRVSVD